MRNFKRRAKLAEINVVPYIDVMLVLLVIFMVTAPMLFQGVDVNLPAANAKAVAPHHQEPIVVSIDSKGLCYLNIAPTPTRVLTLEELTTLVAQALPPNTSQPNQRHVLIKADKAVAYDNVIRAMVALQKAGAVNIGLLSKPPTP